MYSSGEVYSSEKIVTIDEDNPENNNMLLEYKIKTYSKVVQFSGVVNREDNGELQNPKRIIIFNKSNYGIQADSGDENRFSFMYNMLDVSSSLYLPNEYGIFILDRNAYVGYLTPDYIKNVLMKKYYYLNLTIYIVVD